MSEQHFPPKSSKEARILFVAHYRALFGPFPAERDEAEYRLWAAVIDTIEPARMEQVCELMKLARREAKNKDKPRLDDLRAAAGKISGRFRPAAPAAPARSCSMCGGSGYFSVPARPSAPGSRTYVFETAPGDKAPLTLTAFPCKCDAGKPHRAGVDWGSVERAADIMRCAMRACAVTDDDRPMTLREFLAQHQGDKVLSVSGLFSDVIAESLRTVYGPTAAPKPAEDLLPSPTLKYLRALVAGRVERVQTTGLPGISMADIADALDDPREQEGKP
jgi:hypothetical protein